MHKGKVLVIGGGASGIAAALEAAANQFHVYLIEKNAGLGGWAFNYCCKATNKCAKCSACLIPQAKLQVEKNPLITILCNSTIEGFTGSAPDYKVKIKDNSGTVTEIEVGAIIVTIGFKPFDVSRKGEFAYDREKNVITGLELEKAIREKGSVEAAFGKLSSIGFIQCVGSRDMAEGNNYCSKVCCMYTSKLARMIRAEAPDLELVIFYMDLQTFGQGFKEFIESAREDDKIQFIRGIPAKIFGFPYDRLTVRYANSLTGEAIEDKFDLIVLSSAITPAEDSSRISRLLNIDIDEHGFFKTGVLDPVETKQPGIFVAGACQSPKDIPGSIEQAKTAVSSAVKYLTAVDQ